MKMSLSGLILNDSRTRAKFAQILIDDGKPVPPDVALDVLIQEYVNIRLGGTSDLVGQSSFPSREFVLRKYVSGWRSMDSAPKDGTELYATDYDATEIVSWGTGGGGVALHLGGDGWFSRDGQAFFPACWQPLPKQPALPQPPQGGEVEA